MKTNHHTRQGYERLYLNICRETNEIPHEIYSKWGDHQLLIEINALLLVYNCKPFAPEEIEDILHVLIDE